MRLLNPPTWLRAKAALIAIAVVLVLVVVGGGIVLRHNWPFTENSVRSRLEASTSAQVQFASFHSQYFPPGCEFSNVIFRRGKSDHPLIVIQRLTIRSGFLDLFRQRVSLLKAEGLRAEVGRSDFAARQSTAKETTIGEFVADGAVLEVHQGTNDQPLRFLFHQLRLRNLGGSGATKFTAVLDNPMPAGLIRTSGQFGPWNHSDAAETAVSGTYSLESADLGVFHAIAGRISSSGNFTGTFKQLAVSGLTTTPKFEVTHTNHILPLETQFDATVNTTNGETILHDVRGKFGRDEIEARGRIGSQSDGKRAAVIDLSCERGRIEDTFYPFITSPKSPVVGNVRFRMHIVIPSGREPFLQKIQLSSDFQMLGTEFTNQQTETRMSKVAEAPHQKEPVEMAAEMVGRVQANNGVAYFPNLSVRDGNASAQFHGSYNLLDERVNMHGKLTTEASLAKTTSGVKAVFAKGLEVFLKKRHHEKVVPVKISGTYRHPNFGLDMQSSM